MKYPLPEETWASLQQRADALFVDAPLCCSGQRPLGAGIALKKGDFTQVINVLEVFEGGLDDNHRVREAGRRFDGPPASRCWQK